MPSDPVVKIDDLILFFRGDDGHIAKRVVPHSVYTRKERGISVAKEWKTAVLSEHELDKGKFYYVANLSRLLDPGTSPSDPADGAKFKDVIGNKKGKPGVNDLVVIPSDAPDDAYLIPRSVYVKCPTLPDDQIPDLITMAIDEGVVIANLPKLDPPSGFTCYLLSLISLRSGALVKPHGKAPNNKALPSVTKSEHARHAIETEKKAHEGSPDAPRKR